MKNLYIPLKKLRFFTFSVTAIFSLLVTSAVKCQVTQTFLSSTTWTCPAGVTSVTVECWGGGGAGGSSKTISIFLSAHGGGGAGGAYATKDVPVIPGNTYSVMVGAPVSSSTTNNAVVSGNPTWFATPATIYAQGGAGGVSKSGSGNGTGGIGSSGLSIGSTVYKGANGIAGAAFYGGGGGSSAGISGNGNAGNALLGGTAPFGGGAGGTGSISGNGTGGSVPGGGGGGAASLFNTSQQIGGAGASGQVKLTYAACPAIPVITPSAATICQGDVQNLSVAAFYNTNHSGVTGAGATFNNSTTYPNPLNTSQYGEWTQCLVTAAQLAGMGYVAGSSINSVALNVRAINGNVALKNFTISMGTTASAALTTIFISSLSQVYTNPSYTVTAGLNTWTLNSSFYWDGVSNIVVEFIFDGSTSTISSGGGASTYYTATASNTVTYYTDFFAAGSNAALKSAGYSQGTVSNQLPNITFTGSNPSTTWLPAAGLYTDAAASLSYTGTPLSTVYASPAATTTYTVSATNSVCTTQNNTTVTVNPATWLGINSDWNNPVNWCGGIPTSSTNVLIPVVGSGIYPATSSATAKANDITIAAGASVTVNAFTLQIAGAISNSGTFDVTNGTVEFNGTTPQTIPANVFFTNKIKDLIISNDVSLAGTDSLTELLSFGSTNKTFATNGNLTIKSTISGTGSVGAIMNGNAITGDVTVERYIATGTAGSPSHPKSWQLLAIPTFGSQTIKDAWQEGATATNISSPAAGSAGNPVAGYGTMITSAVAGATAQPDPGFDAQTPSGPSMEYYDSSNSSYIGPTSTQAPIFNQRGYFVFVRGDRSVISAFAPANPTILRTRGTLFTPANPPLVSNVAADLFESVGNPYASAIDIRKINLTGGVTEFITVWDPRLGGSYNYGGFATLFYNGGTGNYEVIPGGTPYNYIQSGQAFFVQSFGSPGTVSFDESAKANGSVLFTLPSPVNPLQNSLRINLNMLNPDGSAGSIIDGILTQFDDRYSNLVNSMDARKFANTGENLSIKTEGKLLTIERRKLVTRQDTIFLNLTGVGSRQYQLHFEAADLPTNMQAYLEDSYLKKNTLLNMNGTTNVNFSVGNAAASYKENRFSIVFLPLKSLPVAPAAGPDITVYPNPVANGMIYLQLTNEPAGKYITRLFNNAGKLVLQKQFTHAGGNGNNFLISDYHVAHGIYQLEVVEPGGSIKYFKVIY